MQPGQLDRQIEIHAPTTSVDAIGQETVSWSLWAKPWAQYETSTGDETFDAAQRTAEQKGTFRIRYRPGVTPKMRVVYDTQIYDILDVAEPNRREWLVLTVRVHELSPGA